MACRARESWLLSWAQEAWHALKYSSCAAVRAWAVSAGSMAAASSRSSPTKVSVLAMAS